MIESLTPEPSKAIVIIVLIFVEKRPLFVLKSGLFSYSEMPGQEDVTDRGSIAEHEVRDILGEVDVWEMCEVNLF
jgi:hypothetical protein